MLPADVEAVIGLQPLAFPPPFSSDLHWDSEHILAHLHVFPHGQWVAESQGAIIASCSNTRVSEEKWQMHGSWYTTVGGPNLEGFAVDGSTLNGLDIAVHPEFRRKGIARSLYLARFALVAKLGLIRYGTACRMPGLRSWLSHNPLQSAEQYLSSVSGGAVVDQTLTPLLRLGLTPLTVIKNYMMDEESLNNAALLEWIP